MMGWEQGENRNKTRTVDAVLVGKKGGGGVRGVLDDYGIFDDRAYFI